MEEVILLCQSMHTAQIQAVVFAAQRPFEQIERMHVTVAKKFCQSDRYDK